MAESSIVLLNREEICAIFSQFKKNDPAPKTELVAVNPFTLMVSVVLSAQATDKSVNKATGALYKAAQTPEKIAALGEAGLIPYIQSIGLYRTKAKHIIQLSRMLVAEYGADAGCVNWDSLNDLNKSGKPRFPRTRDEFEKLPGVGRKSANVVLNVVYGELTMPVDTHLLRISPRIGLSDSTVPIQVEQDLLRIIPQEYLTHAHHWLVLHGRYVCTARNPQCESCLITLVCKKNGIVANS